MKDLIFVSFLFIFPLLMSCLNTSSMNHKRLDYDVLFYYWMSLTNTGIYISFNTAIH